MVLVNINTNTYTLTYTQAHTHQENMLFLVGLIHCICCRKMIVEQKELRKVADSRELINQVRIYYTLHGWMYLPQNHNLWCAFNFFVVPKGDSQRISAGI